MTEQERALVRRAMVRVLANDSVFDEAMAILDAEDKPSVPMAMLKDVYKIALDYGRGLSDWDMNACIDIAARYGYTTKEVDDGL